MEFPNNKLFAFSILDDTDDSTLKNIRPVYEMLWELGFRTTKTAWPFDSPEGSPIFFAAETLQNEAYLEYVHILMDRGFELAFHGATMEPSRRDRTIRGLEYFYNEFGKYPRLYCNHGYNRENIYWGHKRFQNKLFRLLFRIEQKYRKKHKYIRSAAKDINFWEGEREISEYFWGDLCQKHIQYVRNFTYKRLNLLEVNPEMPYKLRNTRYVNYWFSTADAQDVGSFNKLFTTERIDELERSGGVCLISTHLGKGFAKNGKVNSITSKILEYIASKRGWFAPVSDILDFLLEKKESSVELTDYQCFRLEFRYILDSIFGLKYH